MGVFLYILNPIFDMFSRFDVKGQEAEDSDQDEDEVNGNEEDSEFGDGEGIKN